MNDKIRALRDPEYRSTSDVKITHPAGLQELEDTALASITGGCAGVPGCTGGNGSGNGNGNLVTTPVFSCLPGQIIAFCP